MSINRNLVINYLLICAVVIISLFLLTSCSKSEMKRDNELVSDDISGPTIPIHEPTLPFEQSATEDETTIEVTTIGEPTTQPTTEAVTTKPTEKTTQKTTVKTENTKSTTTEKTETVKTTTEDVPQPEPEAIAERPEKLTQELRDWIASAQSDELIRIEVLIARPTDEEIDARVLAEYGLSYPFPEPDTIPVVGPVEDGASTASVPEEMKYFDAFNEVKSDEYISRIEAFLDGFVPEERKPILYTKYSTSICFEANAEEILLYTSAPQVERIYMNEISYDDVGEPEPSDEEDIIEASDPTTSD